MAHSVAIGALPSRGAPWTTRTVVVIIGALFCAPGAIVMWRAARLGGSVGEVLRELVGPASRSAVLTVLVAGTCAIVGTFLAWVVTMTDVPGRRWWRVVLVLPLVWPSFVGATAVLSGLTPGGALAATLDLVGIDAPPRLRGLVPAWVMLSAFSYPYVMIPVMARLQAMRPSLDESARLLGLGPWQVFCRVTLVHVRPAVVGGTLICALYMLSEFGAVQLFGYDTLTRVIYATRQTDRATSFIAAAILFVAAVCLVAAVRWTQRHATVDERSHVAAQRPTQLGLVGRAGALMACVVVAVVGVGAPLLGLGGWAWRGIAERRVQWGDLARPAWNTGLTAVLAAAVALLVVWPVAQSVVRHGDRVGRLAGVAVVSGFALPSVVIALALAVFTLNTPVVDRLYQTLALLVIAHAVHFGSQALATTEQAFRSVDRNVADASRLLQPSRWRRLITIDLPLMRPNLAAASGLVMLSVAKELPATLLLAPLGFRTLSTDVWASFEEGLLADAAVGALVLLVVSSALTWVLVLRGALTGRGRHDSAV